MCTVSHREGAAEMVAGFGKGFRRAGTERDVPQVDLLGDAVRRSKAGNQTLEALRRIKLKVATGEREADRHGAGRDAALHLHEAAVDRGAARGTALPSVNGTGKPESVATDLTMTC